MGESSGPPPALLRGVEYSTRVSTWEHVNSSNGAFLRAIVNF